MQEYICMGRGGKTAPGLTFEPLDGFSNFKKVNDLIFSQQFSKMIRFIEFEIVQVLGGNIRRGVVKYPSPILKI